ncbi:hypothetical protein ACM0L0_02225 [Mycoplasma sp. 005V]|uniref:hypothetical protein n=1 Tax=Mycoplasma sp. 005V TaxID=3398776 RepID=UPI003A891642
MKKPKWFFSLPLVTGVVLAPLAAVACNDTKSKDEEISKLKAEKEQLNQEKSSLLVEKAAKEAELLKVTNEKEELTKSSKAELESAKSLHNIELEKLTKKIEELEKINNHYKEENLKLQSEKEIKLAEGITEEKLAAVEEVESIEAIVAKIKNVDGDSIDKKIAKFIAQNYSDKEKAEELSTSIFLESNKYKDNEKVKAANVDFSKLDNDELQDSLKFAVELVDALQKQ